MQDAELEPKPGGRGLQALRKGLGKSWIGRVDERRDNRDLWQQFVQQLQPLLPQRSN